MGRLCPQLHDELVVLELGLKLASLVLPSFLLPASLACALTFLTQFHDERTPGCIIPTITTLRSANPVVLSSRLHQLRRTAQHIPPLSSAECQPGSEIGS